MKKLREDFKSERISRKGMIQRCYNKNNPSYKDYGGRGITVCERWLDKENGNENFCEDMGKKPSPKHSIDRINNNGNYEPSNCRWVTKAEQNNNTRQNHLIEYNEEIHNVTEWSEILDIDIRVLKSRLQRGWTIEKAFTEPLKRRTPTVVYKTETYTFIECEEKFGIPKEMIRARRKRGWDDKRIVETPPYSREKLIEYNGEQYNVSQLSIILSLTESCIHKRLSLGWSHEKIINTPSGGNNEIAN